MKLYRVKLGPVVGKIESGTVRILLECDNEVNCNLKIKIFSPYFVTEKIVNCFVGPNIFVVKLLNNDEPHTIEFTNAISNKTSAVCSFTPAITGTAIISCDGDGFYHYNTGNKTASWKTANCSNVSHAIHIGDQVYIDQAYSFGMAKITDTMSDEQTEVIFANEIRKIYYDSWYKCDEKRKFLATHSNIMIIDDHDIYDNFTSIDFKENVYVKPQMKLFMDVAARIAGEYQIGLSQDTDIETYDQLQSIEKVSILESDDIKYVIVNSRLTKSHQWMFDVDTKKQILEHIQNIPNKKVVLVDQVSPFLLSHQYMQVRALYRIGGIDITDHVTYKNEWINDYNWLFSSLCNSDAKHVVYVTGDLHMGQHHYLNPHNKHKKKIRCLTSSPMSSNVGLPDNFIIRWLLSNFSQEFKGFEYESNSVFHNNFVVVDNFGEYIHLIR
jgi:hypothetical protein